jgi:hypothetical protein
MNSNNHISFVRDEGDKLEIRFCAEGVKCFPCRKVMETVIRKDLQKWSEDVFEDNLLFLEMKKLTMDEKYLKTRGVSENWVEEESKKILEKINAKGVVVRVDPIAKLKGVSMTCLVVSSEPLEKGWEKTFFNLEDNLLDGRTTTEQSGLVDVYEFFVWAVPMSLTQEEIEFVSSLAGELKNLIENRVVAVM